MLGNLCIGAVDLTRFLHFTQLTPLIHWPSELREDRAGRPRLHPVAAPRLHPVCSPCLQQRLALAAAPRQLS